MGKNIKKENGYNKKRKIMEMGNKENLRKK